MFDVHNEDKPMSSRADIKAFFVENGVKAADFDAAFDSFSLDAWSVKQCVHASLRHHWGTRRHHQRSLPHVRLIGWKLRDGHDRHRRPGRRTQRMASKAQWAPNHRGLTSPDSNSFQGRSPFRDPDFAEIRLQPAGAEA